MVDLIDIRLTVLKDRATTYMRMSADEIDEAIAIEEAAAEPNTNHQRITGDLWQPIQLKMQYLRHGSVSAQFLNLLAAAQGQWLGTSEMAKQMDQPKDRVKAVPRGIGNSVKNNHRVPDYFPYERRWNYETKEAEFSMTAPQAAAWEAAKELS
jgi:hypothetical protein